MNHLQEGNENAQETSPKFTNAVRFCISITNCHFTSNQAN